VRASDSEPAGGDLRVRASDSEPAGGDLPVRVVLVDDHALVREGVRSVLGHFDDVAVVAEADNADAAVKAVTAHEPDVVVLDLQLPDEHGVQVLRGLTAQGMDPAVLVLSDHDRPDRVRDVLRAGALGYLEESARPDELADGIRRVAAGQWVIGERYLGMLVDAFIGTIPLGVPPVTPREQQVLRLLAEGLPNRAVAERLGISTRTAQKHVENLFKKFNVHGRGELVAVAGRSGLLA
jgi:DNA-binding NarL/FixJ family response regulator